MIGYSNDWDLPRHLFFESDPSNPDGRGDEIKSVYNAAGGSGVYILVPDIQVKLVDWMDYTSAASGFILSLSADSTGSPSLKPKSKG